MRFRGTQVRWCGGATVRNFAGTSASSGCRLRVAGGLPSGRGASRPCGGARTTFSSSRASQAVRNANTSTMRCATLRKRPTRTRAPGVQKDVASGAQNDDIDKTASNFFGPPLCGADVAGAQPWLADLHHQCQPQPRQLRRWCEAAHRFWRCVPMLKMTLVPSALQPPILKIGSPAEDMLWSLVLERQTRRVEFPGVEPGPVRVTD